MIGFGNKLTHRIEKRKFTISYKGEEYVIKKNVILFDFGEDGRCTIPIYTDKNGKEFIKYSKRTKAFKLLAFLMCEKLGFKKLNDERLVKALLNMKWLRDDDKYKSVDFFIDLVVGLWNYEENVDLMVKMFGEFKNFKLFKTGKKAK